jgi:hypothetical protein|tara:strand:+ start:266 stop:517 length:252 start_codon:yes stop_codon:yes gene_type:complete
MIKQSLLKEISNLKLDELMLLQQYITDTRASKGRNTMSVGSKVWVVQKTKRTEGVITKMNPKKALVKMNGMIYRVPFSMLELI